MCLKKFNAYPEAAIQKQIFEIQWVTWNAKKSVCTELQNKIIIFIPDVFESTLEF